MNEDQITLRSTSTNSAVANDIVLRQTESTKLLFRPIVVNNPHDSEACIKGWFIFQRKESGRHWEECESLPLSSLRGGEWMKLELKASEVLTLLQKFEELKNVYQQNGITFGETQFQITRGNLANVVQQILQLENHDLVISSLENMTPDDLQNFGSLIEISKLKKALDYWNENKENSEESSWQNFFTENSWVLSQMFSYSTILLTERAYLGGKGIENTGGNLVDFIYQNQLTNNVAIVEIKTPGTKIVTGQYRTNAFSISEDVSGAIVQILNYKEELQENYDQLANESQVSFNVFNPECLLVLGSITGENLEGDRLKSFELFRNSCRDVKIITFDELFRKVQIFLGLLSTN